jgi:transposase InsO family protein
VASDEARLVARIIELATQYGRYGYRRITAMLRREGWRVNHKRVERLWRREGLKVPKRQPRRRRLWVNDGSCVRHRAMHRNHVWSYDFVSTRTHDGLPHAIVLLATFATKHKGEKVTISIARNKLLSMHREITVRLSFKRGVCCIASTDKLMKTEGKNGSFCFRILCVFVACEKLLSDPPEFP